jgi:hypothetical protein
MNHVRALMVTLMLVATPTFSMSAPGPSRDSAIPGSYEVRVCSGPCSFADRSNVLAGGMLVLGAEAINPEVTTKLKRARYRPADSLQGPPNGCFIVSRIQNAHTFVGLIPLGFTHWSANSNRVQFGLYASSDAQYVASVVVDADGFKGSGVSNFSEFSDPLWPSDFLIARRVGPADVDRCIHPPQPTGAVEPPRAPDGGRASGANR